MVRPIRSLLLLLSVSLGVGLLSCKDQSMINSQPLQKPILLPTSIEWHSDGTLAHWVYRSLFAYNSQNQLLSVRDSLLTSGDAPKPWAQFSYTANRLTTITLNTELFDNTLQSYSKASSFSLTYVGNTLTAQAQIGDQPVKQVSIQLNEAGYPVNTNVALGRLYLDNQGHLDYLTESKKNEERNRSQFIQVLDQQYDQHQNIFSTSKEYQLMAALIAASDQLMTLSRPLSILDNPLTNNNLVSRTTKSCTTSFERFTCTTGIITYATQGVNEFGFPTQRSCPSGPMGTFSFTISYKRVN
ncbi:hypothetical protein [Fibrella forsythiae]|uniref:Lipoprotein n=1 Tax=Fibrella forsythiae TaxID=2817061 RepID=A0ABS3JP59_9BACT|nr:hypothetical protein [Fibrella forsythiae]MBO0951787.1 hypothetical protein [Fibrella forsythiae]